MEGSIPSSAIKTFTRKQAPKSQPMSEAKRRAIAHRKRLALLEAQGGAQLPDWIARPIPRERVAATPVVSIDLETVMSPTSAKPTTTVPMHESISDVKLAARTPLAEGRGFGRDSQMKPQRARRQSNAQILAQAQVLVKQQVAAEERARAQVRAQVLAEQRLHAQSSAQVQLMQNHGNFQQHLYREQHEQFQQLRKENRHHVATREYAITGQQRAQARVRAQLQAHARAKAQAAALAQQKAEEMRASALRDVQKREEEETFKRERASSYWGRSDFLAYSARRRKKELAAFSKTYSNATSPARGLRSSAPHATRGLFSDLIVKHQYDFEGHRDTSARQLRELHAGAQEVSIGPGRKGAPVVAGHEWLHHVRFLRNPLAMAHATVTVSNAISTTHQSLNTSIYI